MNRTTWVAVLGLIAACGEHQAHWPEAAPANRCDASAFVAGPIVVDVKMPDRSRQALAWVPRGPGKKDVVFDLHEFRSEPQRQAYYSNWAQTHDAANVILVAPDGKSSTWNAGKCCGAAVEQAIDDVAFLDALSKRIDDVACTSGRVLATGIGNGGMMAERWACESDVPDALISVGGALQLETCTRKRPIPVLHYHGDQDKFVPPDGSAGVLEGGLPGGTTRPVKDAIATWVALDAATPDTPQVDGALSCARWQGVAPVLDCRIAGGADTWPGAENGQVASASPLADATRGGLAWARALWDAPTSDSGEHKP